MKAYTLKASSTSSTVDICPMCEEESSMESRTAWRSEDSDLMYESDEQHYWWNRPVETTVWYCANCCEHTEDGPDSREMAIWVCGQCGWQTHSENDAMDCCL